METPQLPDMSDYYRLKAKIEAKAETVENLARQYADLSNDLILIDLQIDSNSVICSGMSVNAKTILQEGLKSMMAEIVENLEGTMIDYRSIFAGDVLIALDREKHKVAPKAIPVEDDEDYDEDDEDDYPKKHFPTKPIVRKS